MQRTAKGTMLAALALVLAVILAPGTATAEVAVTDLRVGTDASAEPAETVFAPGTRTVYARFDYAEAANHNIAVIVRVQGGVVALQAAQRYSGKGSDAVAISGTSVFQGVSAEAVAAAGNARTNARRAATQQFGLEEYLIQVQASVNRIASVLDVLERLPSSAVDAASLATLRGGNQQVQVLLDRAARAPDDDRKRELAAAMDEPIGEMVAAATALSEQAGQASGVPLPVSGEDWQYVVGVSVNGSPALSTEFIVHGGRITLPLVQK